MDSKKRSPELRNRKCCRRYNEAGHAHLLTFSCFRRRPFLTRPRTRAWMIDAIRLTREKHHLALWGYVIMPEHVHLLVWPRQEPYSVSKILTTLKQSVSKRARLFILETPSKSGERLLDRRPDGRGIFRFWQRGGGYDRNIWEPRYVWEAIEYLHLNPVRRGLCERPEEWRWSSAREYLEVGSGPLPIDMESLPHDPR